MTDYQDNFDTTSPSEKDYYANTPIDIPNSIDESMHYQTITEQLIDNEQYTSFLENLPMIYALTDTDANFTFLNRIGRRTFGITEEEIENGLNTEEFLADDENISKHRTMFAYLKDGILKNPFYDYVAKNRDGTIFHISVYANVIVNESGQVVGLRHLIVNNEEKVQLQHEISEGKAKMTELMDIFGTVGFRLIYKNGVLTADFISENVLDVTGYKAREISSGKINILNIIHPDDIETVRQTYLDSMKNNEDIYSIRFRIITKGQSTRWISAKSKILNSTSDTKIIDGICTDITQSLTAADLLMAKEEEKFRITSKLLNEKNNLLKEIHHRVKNNLQIIASILKLEYMRNDDNKMSAILQDCRDRVFSMAAVHEKLYRSDDLATIPMENYFDTLCSHFTEEYNLEDRKILFNINCSPKIVFDIDTAIPISLIVNEIITNSMKYAFSDKGGTVDIVLLKVEDKYILTIKDNGKGLPPNFDPSINGSLGSELIDNLVIQIGGTMKIDGSHGVKYEIIFKPPK